MKKFLFCENDKVLKESDSNDIDFIVAENSEETKDAIKLAKEHLCGVGLYSPKLSDINSNDFIGKDFPLVVYSEDADVIKHVKDYALIVKKDDYIDYCKKVALHGG